MHRMPFPMYRMPKELTSKAFDFLSTPNLLNLSAVSPSFFSTLRWGYKRHFGVLPFEEDVRAQLLAAYLFYKAKAEIRPDKSYPKFEKFRNFLNLHQGKPWVQYYHGIMLFDGLGVLANIKSGVELLCGSLHSGDYRAAMKLCDWLTDDHSDHTDISEDMPRLLPCLLNAEAKEAQVNKSIALIHLHGFGVPADECKAEFHFKRAIFHDRDPKAAYALAEHYLAIPERSMELAKPKLENVQRAISFSEDSFTRLPISLMACNIGWLYQAYAKDYQKALEWFSKAYELGHSLSARFIAEMYEDDRLGLDLGKALVWYQHAFERDEIDCADKVADMIASAEGYELTEAIKWWKKGYDAGDLRSIISLARHCSLIPYFEWCYNLDMVWLVQTAARCDDDTVSFLLRHSDIPEVQCALHMLKKLGGFFNDHGAPKPIPSELEKTVVDPITDKTLLEKYREAGERLKLLDERSRTFLERWQMGLEDGYRMEFKR